MTRLRFVGHVLAVGNDDPSITNAGLDEGMFFVTVVGEQSWPPVVFLRYRQDSWAYT